MYLEVFAEHSLDLVKYLRRKGVIDIINDENATDEKIDKTIMPHCDTGAGSQVQYFILVIETKLHELKYLLRTR